MPDDINYTVQSDNVKWADSYRAISGTFVVRSSAMAAISSRRSALWGRRGWSAPWRRSCRRRASGNRELRTRCRTGRMQWRSRPPGRERPPARNKIINRVITDVKFVWVRAKVSRTTIECSWLAQCDRMNSWRLSSHVASTAVVLLRLMVRKIKILRNRIISVGRLSYLFDC